MKKKIIAILMAGCMTCSLAACGSDEGEKGKEGREKITFVLDWTPNTNHTGLYVAQEKGYFEDEGLDVEIVHRRRTEQTPLSLRGKRSLEFLFRIRWHLE